MLSVEEIAKVCHEINRAYCQAIGDASQVPWASAETWQKESAINGVIKIIEEPDFTPEMSHKAWCDDKFKDGWVFGPVKDAEAKTHPALILYDDLSKEVKAKDYIFLAIVNQLLNI